MTLPIDWAELDLYGHVNNVAYYRYMQSARIAFCEAAGLTTLNAPDKPSFILAASECHYKKKLFFPGEIQILSQVTEINNSSFHLEHRILDQQGELAAHGRDVLVVYDYAKGHKISIPDEIRQFLMAAKNNSLA